MKIAYLDCFSGISGDMFLAALVDAGVPFAILQEAVAALGLEATLTLRRVDRSGIDAANIDVLTADGRPAEAASDASVHTHNHETGSAHTHDHVHVHTQEDSHSHTHSLGAGASHDHGRSLSAIEAIIHGASLPAEVKTLAVKAFRLLGWAEAKIHNVPIETIHFHEVGAVDAIADIVAAAAGCHWLQAERWLCSPLNVGGGHVHCAHGKFPVPAPATLELLRDLPVYSSGVQKELVTPTGAALLRALDVTSSGFPAMRLTATGYGAGSKDIAGQPNVLRLVVGESVIGKSVEPGAFGNSPIREDRVGVIETTIDDATSEVLAYVAEQLLAAGASDVYRTPVQMKKGRTGTQLTILCSPGKAEALQRLVFRETTTLGLRYREEQKKTLVRSFTAVETPWGEIRIKVASLPDGEIINHAPEYEDCRRIAEKYAVPLKHVMQAASAAYLALGPKA